MTAVAILLLSSGAAGVLLAMWAMGDLHLPKRKPKHLTALEHVREMYALEQTDLPQLERQVEWLLARKLGDSYEEIVPGWPRPILGAHSGTAGDMLQLPSNPSS